MKDENIKKVLLLGSGALKIGEAGEFDYSGALCRGDRADTQTALGQDRREDHRRGDREHVHRHCDCSRGEDQLPRRCSRRDAAGADV